MNRWNARDHKQKEKTREKEWLDSDRTGAAADRLPGRLQHACAGANRDRCARRRPQLRQQPRPRPIRRKPTAPPETERAKLILATTTSTENSGLLAYLLPDFEAEYGVEVDVIAVGTGQALTLGEDGNADVLLVHARAREDAFMEAGHGVRREDVMYNDFVIVGPANDPAGIAGMTDAAEALAKIAEAEAPFVSRGDDSGTHTKEKAIWEAAGIEPSGDWYISAGQGMGAVLTMADEQQAYTLSDRATYLARTLEGTELEILVEGDPILFNPYGVMAVNPDKGDHIQADLANTFIDWLISVPTQEKIGQFGVDEFGAPLFTPDSAPWREAHPAAEAPEAEALPAASRRRRAQDHRQGRGRDRLDRGPGAGYGHDRGPVDQQGGRDLDLYRRADQRSARTGRPAGRRGDVDLCRRRWLYRRGGTGRGAGLLGLYRLVPQPGRVQHGAARLSGERAGQGRDRDPGQVGY